MSVFKDSVTCPVTEDVLPDKLSELLNVALKDLKKCERSKKYEVYMMAWHLPNSDKGTCMVCLAGSVMAKEFKLSPSECAAWSDIKDDKVKSKIVALSDIAFGVSVNRTVRLAKDNVKAPFVEYRKDSKKWWKYMRELLRNIKKLEK